MGTNESSLRDDELWFAQFRQEKAEYDRLANLAAAREKHEKELAEALATGRAEGRAEGEAKGRAEGKREQSLENARNMLANGVTPELISKWLGLSIDEIKSLNPA